MSSKENDVLTVGPDLTGSSAGPRPEDTATTRPQPVALEVPVTVNGARAVEGSDKREPFSETTKTVLVFGNGAVIRLGSPVAPGQLLFLTNEKTKKEVVCQVVKSKNYRSASGYVELEFTESVVGFWGMRFPSDKAAAPAGVRPSPTSPVATENPVSAVPPAPKPTNPISPTLTSAPRPPEPKPITTQTPASIPTPMQPATPTEPARLIPVAPAAQVLPEAPATKVPEPPVTHAAGFSSSLATSLASLLGEEGQTPAPPANSPKLTAPPQGKTPVPGSNESEDLKMHTARLQEQLSSLLFSPAPVTRTPGRGPGASAADTKAVPTVAAQVLEIAKTDMPNKPAPPAKSVSAPAFSSLDTEEVKIPAWLEPLARNAAAPASTQELIEREKAKHAAEPAQREETSEQPLPITAVEPVPSPAVAELPAIGPLTLLDEPALAEGHRSKGSGKGFWFSVAAAVVLAAAGGAWYFLQPAKSAQDTAVPFANSANSQTQSPTASVPTVQQALSAPPSARPTVEASVEPSTSIANSAGTSQPPMNSARTTPATGMKSPNSQAPSQTSSLVRDNAKVPSAAVPAAERERISRPAPEPEPEPKKPSIGDVHLASPMMNRHTASQNDGVAAPTLATGADVPDAGGLGSGLGNSGKPAAPAPVGGDVTPAKLLSKVDAMYPAMAKSQHVSGDVLIDALIDTNGRVTTMKVISGPTLLHQAAMDALRQWKYKPASLDGNPVPMHLTVRLQFRIQ